MNQTFLVETFIVTVADDTDSATCIPIRVKLTKKELQCALFKTDGVSHIEETYDVLLA